MTEEQVRLVLQLTGRQSIQEATADLRQMADVIDDIQGTGTGKSGSKGGGFAGLSQAVSRFGQDAAAGLSAPGDAFQKLNMTIMGTANNLEQLLGAAGIGGLAALLATVGYTLLPLVIKGIGELFKAGEQESEKFTTRLGEVQDKLKDLEEKKIKLQVDYEEIEKAKAEIAQLTKAKQALDGLLGAQSEVERESGQAFGEAIVETEGGQEAVQRARQVARAGGIRGSKEVLDANRKQVAAERALADAEAMGKDSMGIRARAMEAAQKQLDAANAEVKAANDRAASDAEDRFNSQMKTARSGQGMEQQEAQREIARMIRDAGGGAIADALDRADPTFVRSRKASAEAFDASNARLAERNREDAEGARIFDERSRQYEKLAMDSIGEYFGEAKGNLQGAWKDQQKANKTAREEEQKRQQWIRQEEANAREFAGLFEDALGQTGNVEQARMMAMQQMIFNQQQLAAMQAQWQIAYKQLFEQARRVPMQRRGGGF